MVLPLPPSPTTEHDTSNTSLTVQSLPRFGRLGASFLLVISCTRPDSRCSTRSYKQASRFLPISRAHNLVHHVRCTPTIGYKNRPKPLRSPLASHHSPSTPLSHNEAPQCSPPSLLAGGSRNAAVTAWVTCAVTDAPSHSPLPLCSQPLLLPLLVLTVPSVALQDCREPPPSSPVRGRRRRRSRREQQLLERRELLSALLDGCDPPNLRQAPATTSPPPAMVSR
jgi:hypothetical protein